MKNVKEAYSKLSNESLDDWLEKENLEIEISGHEPDGFNACLIFKGGRIAPSDYYVYEKIQLRIMDNDITENGLKKALRNIRFSKAEPFVVKTEYKKWFKTEVFERIDYKYTPVVAPNFIVN